MIERTKHIRRLDPRPMRGNWVIDCDCGWRGEVCCTEGQRVRTGEEVERLLNQAFVGHLKPHELSLYILVDQRQKEAWVFDDGKPPSGDDDADDLRPGRLIMTGTGNFVMPEGRPCVLTRHWQADGIHWGHYLEPDSGNDGQLPICEIRTADGRVLRFDGPA